MGINKKDSFWANKKVLITGHTGFKGSWLSLLLLELEANIIGFSLEHQSFPNIYDSLSISRRIKDIRGNIENYKTINQVIDEHNPEIIIHMAAQALVRKSYEDPSETFNTNALGTVNLLESCRHSSSVKVIIIVTSDKCYKNKEIDYFYKESDELGGDDPYSASKACAEIITNSYYKSFFKVKGIGVASVRAGNVIGGGDWSPDRLIPDAIRSFMSNNKLEIRNPDSIRPWQFVLEPLFGYLELCEKLWISPAEFSSGWNFGPEKSNVKKVGEIAVLMEGLWDGNFAWSHTNESGPKEAKLLCLDSSKAKAFLNWKPKLSLTLTLEKTIDWYSEFYNNNENIVEFSINQIKEYSREVFNEV